MASFWGSLSDPNFVPLASGNSSGPNVSAQLKALEFEIERLRLLNQAMWELIREKVGVQDCDLEDKAQEIDLRDGIPDQQMSRIPLKCPRCGRISSSKHYKCIYCGLEFEKPVMG